MSTNSRIQQGIAKEHPEWVLPRLCQQSANKNGIYAAVFGGLLSVPISRRLGLDRNKITFVALAVSSVTGYLVAKYSYKQCIDTYEFTEAVNREHQGPNGSL